MELRRDPVAASGKRFSYSQNGQEVGRAYLYVMNNDLHDAPFGLLEDVFVDELARGQGIGSRLVQEVIAEARRLGCYKLICTSRFSKEKVHEMYERLGFKRQGIEFRLDL